MFLIGSNHGCRPNPNISSWVWKLGGEVAPPDEEGRNGATARHKSDVSTYILNTKKKSHENECLC